MKPLKLNPDGKISSGVNISYWADSVEPLFYSPLETDTKCDVLIIGAGIAGLSTAYRLCKQGYKVIVLEDGAIGSGESGRTSAHLVNALDDRYYILEKELGQEMAKMAVESHTEAVNFIERTSREENIDCDFRRVPGYLFLHPSDKESNLEKEYDACIRLGVNVSKEKDLPGIRGNAASFCIEFKQQAEFHPLKYIQGLAKAITAMGGVIYTETHAREINTKGAISAKGFKVEAEHIVVATNTPVNKVVSIHSKQFAFRTYLIAALVLRGSLPRALWWDTGDHNMDSEVPPYHYVRLIDYDASYDLLLAGGEDHNTGIPDDTPEEERYKALEQWTREHFDIKDIKWRWSGQVMEPADSLAYIGVSSPDEKNIYIVTGDSGNGLTHGTIAGLLIPDLIAGKENPWERLYKPQRFKIAHSLRTWLKEVGGGLFNYFKQKDKDREKTSINAIERDQAEIVDLEGEKYGVFKDHGGCIHLVSASCTHMGCTVRWNNDEKSWDCPCHGSRFTHEGKVMHGPANQPLFYYRESEEEQLRHAGTIEKDNRA